MVILQIQFLIHAIKDILSRIVDGLGDICKQVINDGKLKITDVLKTVKDAMKDIIYEAVSHFIRGVSNKILAIDLRIGFLNYNLDQLYF